MAGNVDWGITGTLRMIKLLRETSRKIKISELKRKASEVEDECPRVGGGGVRGQAGRGRQRSQCREEDSVTEAKLQRASRKAKRARAAGGWPKTR